MAARDCCALVRCPRCGAEVMLSGEVSAVVRAGAGWLSPVLVSLCGCWVQDLYDGAALHLWIQLAA